MFHHVAILSSMMQKKYKLDKAKTSTTKRFCFEVGDSP